MMPEDKNAKLKRSIIDRTLLWWVPISLLVAAAVSFNHLSSVNQQQQVIKNDAKVAVNDAFDAMKFRLSWAINDLAFINDMIKLESSEERFSATGRLSKQLAAFMGTRTSIYYQLRVLDESGMEKIRIDNFSGLIHTTNPEQLQNKSDRYYIQNAMNMHNDSIYISPLDLNVEQGQIEKPYRSVMRIVGRLTDNKQNLLGFVVINYLGEDLLLQLEKAFGKANKNFWIINQKGDWIKSPDPAYDWNFMFEDRKNQNITTQYPVIWNAVQHAQNQPIQEQLDSGIVTAVSFTAADIKHPLNKKLVSNSNYKWYFVLFQPMSDIEKINAQSLQSSIIQFVVISFIFGILIYYNSRLWEKNRFALAKSQESEDFYRLLLDATPDGIVVCDEEGKIIQTNPQVGQMFGYQENELLGEYIEILIPPKARLAHKAHRFNFMSKPTKREMAEGLNLMGLKHDGSEFPVHISLNYIDFSKGRIAVAQVRDVSQSIVAQNRIKDLNKKLNDQNNQLDSLVKERTEELNQSLGNAHDLQNRLRATMATMDLALDTTGLGIWTWNVGETDVSWDKRMHAIYLDSDKVNAQTVPLSIWREHIVEEDLEKFDKKMRQIIIDKRLMDFVFRINKNNEVRHIRMEAFLEHDSNNMRVIGINQDITEQINSEDKFKKIISAAPVSMLIIDQQQKIRLINNRLAEMCGYAEEELIDQPIDILIPERFLHNHHNHVSGFMTSPNARPMGQNQEIFALRKDKTEVPVEIGLNPLHTSDGNFVIAAITDITLRKEIEKIEHQGSLRRINLATAASNLGIWEWSFKDNQVIWDLKMFEIFGFGKNVIAGQESLSFDEFCQFIHPDDRTEVIAELEILTQSDRLDSAFNRVFRIIGKDSFTRYIQCDAKPEKDIDGNLVQAVGVCRDVTDQKINELQIKQLNTDLEQKVISRTNELNNALALAKQASVAKSDFLSNMSHEIRTPMNAILGMCYLLEKQTMSSIARSMTKKIHTAGKSLLGIINDILDFSKIEANKLEIENIPFFLNEVLENTASIMSAAVGNKKIELIIDPPPRGCNTLTGDPLRLGQIFINLTSNAIKFTETGEVHLRIEQIHKDENSDQVQLRFSVKDTGTGISPEKLNNIFQAFSQADTSTTRNFGGTGLGLSISRHLVALMGGELQVESKLGEGSCFYFTLTMSTSDLKHVTPPDIAKLLPKMKNQRVLIVDDQPSALEVMQEIVKSLDWQSITAKSGEEALETFRQHQSKEPFDLLMIDWQMPGMDGLQALKRMFEEQQGEKPSVIMITAHDREKLYDQKGFYLVDTVLSKPVTGSALFNAAIESRNRQIHQENKAIDNHNERLVNARILVVDDSDINRDVAERILTDEGAIVELAVDGQDAVNIISSTAQRFDAVLMDVQMPVMDGYTATGVIRNQLGLKDLPVIALTAGAMKGQRDNAIAAGMTDFIPKPFDVDELVNTLLTLIKLKPGEKPVFTIVKNTEKDIKTKDFEIDFEKGLKIWKSEEVFSNYLNKFKTDYNNFFETLNTDKKENIARLHKLRGASGSLGIAALSQHAGQMEDKLSKDQSLNEEELNTLQKALISTFEQIDDFINLHQIADSADNNVDNSPEKATPVLNKLIMLLEQDDLDEAELCLTELEKLISHDLYDPVKSAIDDFDFKQGRQAIQHIADTLAIQLEI